MNAIYLWDYVDGTGRNLIVEWLTADRISLRDRAKLNQKLDSLLRIDFDLAVQTKLLARVGKYILKLRVFGEVQLRPMLCQGPIDLHGEYTLLAGAREVGGKLRPENVVALALDRRGHITVDGGNKRRCKHEPF